MTTLTRRTLDYAHDGVTMAGELVIDETPSRPRPGVLVLHEAFGLGDHAIRSAERLAGLGYAAFAMDLWGAREQISEMPAVMNKIGAITTDRAAWMGRVASALDALASTAGVDRDRLAAIGYCFGGATVLEFARTGGAIKAAVSLHGALSPLGAEWSSARTTAKLLVCTGAKDPLVPATDVATLQERLAESGVDWEIDIYSDTRHSFTNPDLDEASMPGVIGYNAQSDQRSWRRLTSLFEEVFR